MPDGRGTATVTFFEVSAAGATTLDAARAAGRRCRAGYFLAGGRYYDINTTADFGEPVTLCIPYDPATFAGRAVRLLHFDGSIWIDVTTMNDPFAGLVCGQPEELLALRARLRLGRDAAGVDHLRAAQPEQQRHARPSPSWPTSPAR